MILYDRQAPSIETIMPGYELRSKKRRPRLSMKPYIGNVKMKFASPKPRDRPGPRVDFEFREGSWKMVVE